MFPSLKNSSEFSFPFITCCSEDRSKNLDFFSKNPYFPYLQDLQSLNENTNINYGSGLDNKELNTNEAIDGKYINKMAFFEKQPKKADEGSKEIKEKD